MGPPPHRSIKPRPSEAFCCPHPYSTSPLRLPVSESRQLPCPLHFTLYDPLHWSAMPSYRFHQKTKSVAGSTPNRTKFQCMHESCQGRLAPLACASTYARHFRSAHFHERHWRCEFGDGCTFDTTRKTLLKAHYAQIHGQTVEIPKRARGTLKSVPPPIEVEVDEFDNIICYRPAKYDRAYGKKTTPPPSPASDMYSMMSLDSLHSYDRQLPSGRRPSLTVKTDASSPSSSCVLSTMSLPTVPPVMQYCSQPQRPSFPAQTPQMQYDSPDLFIHYSAPMGSAPYPDNTVYSMNIFPEAEAAQHMSAFDSATAINSAVPWAVWSTPASASPKPLFPQSWDASLSASSTPTSSPTPFPEMSLDQHVYDPELETILNGINNIKECSPF
ncbi:hypothetical protein CALCODRAFT_247478 [Calocera cornea HHB12733]|uniref:Uncharacterized protein n=1 Tax=Calocera cornea HHB12733 TaxID=1353952 RepID=A0A165JV80_9BASI|nr:hypothetical protein CALCODRAFT_247478 [Calocera cornea HHB12733]